MLRKIPVNTLNSLWMHRALIRLKDLEKQTGKKISKKNFQKIFKKKLSKKIFKKISKKKFKKNFSKKKLIRFTQRIPFCCKIFTFFCYEKLVVLRNSDHVRHHHQQVENQSVQDAWLSRDMPDFSHFVDIKITGTCQNKWKENKKCRRTVIWWLRNALYTSGPDYLDAERVSCLMNTHWNTVWSNGNHRALSLFFSVELLFFCSTTEENKESALWCLLLHTVFQWVFIRQLALSLLRQSCPEVCVYQEIARPKEWPFDTILDRKCSEQS